MHWWMWTLPAVVVVAIVVVAAVVIVREWRHRRAGAGTLDDEALRVSGNRERRSREAQLDAGHVMNRARSRPLATTEPP